MPTVKTHNAAFSPCRRYRYHFSCVWEAEKPAVMIIGLNPTVIDPKAFNPTIKRCLGFADAWGFGRLVLVNLFAVIAESPSVLRSIEEPVGLENDAWIDQLNQSVDRVVCAWGNDGSYLGRGNILRGRLSNPYCIKMNRSGEPAHPLYLRSCSQIMPC